MLASERALSGQLVLPSPSLPWELLLHIVALADPPALALLARTSYDLLVAASPLLYHTVDFSSRRQIELFLCSAPPEADDSPPPPNRLAVHLSLSQIHHLTLSYSSFFTHSSQPLPSFHRLVPLSRLANTDPLALTSLTIPLHPSTAQSAIHLIRTELLPLFNPSTFTLTILPTPPINHAILWQFLSDPYSAPKDFARWDRLERVVLRGVLPFAIASHPYEVVLDMTRGAEWHAGAGGLEMMRLGTRMSPLGRVGFGRRLVLMGMGGGGGEQGKGRVVLRVGSGEGEKVREEVERLEGEGWVGRLGVEENEEG